MKTIQELAQTTQSDVRGTSFTAYALSPVEFLKEIVDAAQKRLYFAQFAYTSTAPEGTKDVVIPKRSIFLGQSGVSYDVSEPTSSDITWTTLNNLDGVTFTPAIVLSGIAIANQAIHTNALDLINQAKEELTYAIGDKVDYAVAQAINNATAAVYNANPALQTRGAQIIYGGDATGDATLATGDTLTTDMISNARMRLMSATCRAWASGVEYDLSTTYAGKNPWMPTPEPIVLFISPEQENVLLKDSQFVNASEYGNNEVVMNGEIGKYIGVKVVVTNNVETTDAGGTPSWTRMAGDSGTVTPKVHRCVLIKANKAIGLVYGRKPELKVFPINERDQTGLTLVASYQAKAIYDDAIVWIDVSDS